MSDQATGFTTDEARWQAALSRNREADGQFIIGVVTTGIYCKPSCPGRPKRENVRFFATTDEARSTGLRACKRCHPDG